MLHAEISGSKKLQSCIGLSLLDFGLIIIANKTILMHRIPTEIFIHLNYSLVLSGMHHIHGRLMYFGVWTIIINPRCACAGGLRYLSCVLSVTTLLGTSVVCKLKKR